MAANEDGMYLPKSTYEGEMGIPLTTTRGETTTTNLGGEASQIQNIQQAGIGNAYADAINKALAAYNNPQGDALNSAMGGLGSAATNASAYAGNSMPVGMQGPGAPAPVPGSWAAQGMQPGQFGSGATNSYFDHSWAQQGVGSGAYSPYMQTGALASEEAARLAGLGSNPMSSEDIYNRYLNNPAVQLQMQQGMQAINSNYGAKGLTGSSSILKALNTFGQGVAAQTIGDAQKNLYNLAGQGATAANQYASNLLSNYQGNINAQLQANQNRNSLLNTQVNALNNQGQLAQGALNNQTGLMSQAAANQAQLATQASLARMSALAGSSVNEQIATDTQGYAKDAYGMPSTPFTGKGGGIGFDKKGAN